MVTTLFILRCDMEQGILAAVIDEFRELAKIPRPSGHEKAVSAYLKKRFERLGCAVLQDEYYNIIADLQASNECEQAPLTILQAHMDMVCVAADDIEYDPVTDEIKLKLTEEFMMAEGTSLGGDDGMGIAVIIAVLERLKRVAHGAIRVIVTVDEEQGMTGARELAREHLQRATYLINCDSETYNKVTIGSAGSVNIEFTKELSLTSPTQQRFFKIAVKGLLGGHSGERIGDDRGNAIQLLARTLKRIKAAGAVEIIKLQGGEARNAIPTEALAVIATDMDESLLKELAAAELANFQIIYGVVEVGADIDVKPITVIELDNPLAMSAQNADEVLNIILLLHTGVFAMSRTVKGLVETSANLGVVEQQQDCLVIKYLPRSSTAERLDDFIVRAGIIADCTNSKLSVGIKSPGWQERQHSRLLETLTMVFEEQNGSPMQVETIHAGLECGWHLQKNPRLDIVSIGVTAFDIHSPKERILLSSIAPEVRLLEETLRRISREKSIEIKADGVNV